MSERLVSFTQEELELLAHGFGFYVQDFNHADDDPVHALLRRLHELSTDTEAMLATDEHPNIKSR